jgi:site-specific recombinase XerD
VDKRVRRAVRRAKVTDGVQFLRHISCSHLAMKGPPTRVIERLAGHRQRSSEALQSSAR